MNYWKIERHDDKMEPIEPIYIYAETFTEAFLEALIQLGENYLPSRGECGITGITQVDFPS